MHEAALYTRVWPVCFQRGVHAGPSVAYHHDGFGESFEQLTPCGLGLTGAPLRCDHVPARSGGEDAPSGTEVEPVDLDHVIHDTGDRDAGAEVPAPGDVASERPARERAIRIGLRGFPEEPVEEPQQGEQLAAIYAFAHR